MSSVGRGQGLVLAEGRVGLSGLATELDQLIVRQELMLENIYMRAYLHMTRTERERIFVLSSRPPPTCHPRGGLQL